MIVAPSITLTPEQCATECCDREAFQILHNAKHGIRNTMLDLSEGALLAIALRNHPGKSPLEAAKREAARITRECAALVKFSGDILAGIEAFRTENAPKINAATKHLSGLRSQIAHQEANRQRAITAVQDKRNKLLEAGLSEADIEHHAPMEAATAVLDAEIARLQAEIEKVEQYLHTSAAGPLPFEVA